MLLSPSPANCDLHVVFPDALPERARWRAPQSIPSALAAECLTLAPDERAFLAWLLRTRGIDLGRYKEETLKRRLPACLRAARSANANDARRLLRRHPQLAAAAISAVVIGVTSFFRDLPVFAAIDAQVLPDLASADGRPRRIWSVGCSDGAELYSVAMLLAERGQLAGSTLLGTDCRADAIARAREGRFDHAIAATAPSHLASRFLTADGNEFRIAPTLRTACRWEAIDAFERTTPESIPSGGAHGDAERWDLILCRNMAIYLRPAAAGLLYRRLAAALRPGGYLVLGRAERPAGIADLRAVGPCVYRACHGGELASVAVAWRPS